MTVKVRDASNTLRQITGFKVRGPDNVLRTVTTIKVRGPDNVLRTVFAPAAGGGGGGGGSGGATFAVTPLNGTIGKSSATLHGTPKTVRTSTYLLTVVGAAAPTFAWSRVSGDAGIVADTPAANPTTFSKAAMPIDTTATAIFKCVVTDGAAAFTVFVTITLYLEWTDIGGTA